MTGRERRARRNYLGGTDLGAILKVHPYRTDLMVVCEKKYGVQTPENDAMRRGTRMEPYVARMVADEMGVPLRRGTTVRHSEHRFLGANPDYIARDGSQIIEIKTHSPWVATKYGESGSGEIPAHEWVQVQHYMHLTGIHRATLAVLFGLDDFRLYPVDYAPVACGSMVEQARDWWARYIMGDEEPVATGLDLGWLAAHFPVDTGVAVDATSEIDTVVDDYRAARAFSAEAESNEANLKAMLQQFMGSAAVLSSSHGDITWKAAKDSHKIDWQAVAIAMAAPVKLIEQHTTTVPGSRRFVTPRAWTKE